MSARAAIPAAAPAWVRSVLAGPERQANVVHRGADAVYLDVDGACLGVLSAGATAVPCAARTTLTALPSDLRHAETARVGAGRVLLGDSEVAVVRALDAAVPRLDVAAAPAAQRRLTDAVGGKIDHVCAELPVEALEALTEGDPSGVPALLGRGTGLTPLGDDVLAGWVATVVAAGVTASPVAAAVAQHACSMTTLLSATLLDCARRGDVVPEFRRLLVDLTAPDTAGLDDSLTALLRVGHTSGAGLALGTLLALRHLASRSTT